jgi:hypothetical protein
MENLWSRQRRSILQCLDNNHNNTANSDRDLRQIESTMLRIFDRPQNAALALPAQQRPG